MQEEVRALIPHLHNCYRAIGRFQKNRSDLNRQAVIEHLRQAGVLLQGFKTYIQKPKQPYFDVILQEDLNISDRIIALDTAVGAMHIEFAVPRAYMHRMSADLKEALERVRLSNEDTIYDVVPQDDGIICRGIPASPGVVSGKVRIVKRNSEYRRLPAGTVAVAHMTRPEVVHGLQSIVAIVTDIGGSLCHAAIVAREMGIPCVVGTEDATRTLRDRSFVCVDGTQGIVSRIRDY